MGVVDQTMNQMGYGSDMANALKILSSDQSKKIMQAVAMMKQQQAPLDAADIAPYTSNMMANTPDVVSMAKDGIATGELKVNNPQAAVINQQGLTPYNPLLPEKGITESVPQVANNTPVSWNDFTNRSVEIAKQRGYPVGVLLAQAAIETGRGTSKMAQTKNNYFGFKAYDANPSAASAYSGVDQSINDYIDLIQNDPRYAKAWKNYQVDKNPTNLIKGIKAAGYATDKDYVSKVTSTPEFRNY
jgi:flagellum-specific peptidoglycan hydrolase FlgJ